MTVRVLGRTKRLVTVASVILVLMSCAGLAPLPERRSTIDLKQTNPSCSAEAEPEATTPVPTQESSVGSVEVERPVVELLDPARPRAELEEGAYPSVLTTLAEPHLVREPISRGSQESPSITAVFHRSAPKAPSAATAFNPAVHLPDPPPARGVREQKLAGDGSNGPPGEGSIAEEVPERSPEQETLRQRAAPVTAETSPAIDDAPVGETETSADAVGEEQSPEPSRTVRAPSGERVSSPEPVRAPGVEASAAEVEAAERQDRVDETEVGVRARLGDAVVVTLEEQGWFFVGPWDQRGVEFVAREVDVRSVAFTFRAIEQGSFTLRFQRQDAVEGIRDEQAYVVEVVGAGVSLTASDGRIPDPAAGTSAVVPAAGDLQRAQRLFEEGRLSESLEEYLSAYEPGLPWLSNRIAELASQLGDPQRATEFWEMTLREDGASEDQRRGAAAGLFNRAVRDSDAALLARSSGYLREEDEVSLGQQLLSAAASIVDASEHTEAAVRLYEAALRSDEYARGVDAILFRLGQIFEGDTALRNERKAFDMYRRIVRQYPASTLWEQARSRAEYLQRHFLQIR